MPPSTLLFDTGEHLEMNPASRFFSALFGQYPADESLRLEIRPLLPEWAKAKLTKEQIEQIHRDVRRWYCLSPQFLHNAAEYACSLSNDFDVYYGVHPRCGRSGSQDNVLWAHALFCDVDGGDEGVPGAIRRVKQAEIDRPDIAIESGNGIHCYWLLDAPTVLPDKDSRERYKRTLRRLCLAIGGTSPSAHADTAACEVARILRVPGTFNHKIQDAPKAVKVLRHIHCDTPDLSRSYDWWRSNLPMEQETAIKGPKAHQPAYSLIGTISPGLENWARRGYPEGKRHQDFAGAAAWLVRDVGLNKSDAAELLKIKAQHSPGRRAITADEIEAMIKWA